MAAEAHAKTLEQSTMTKKSPEQLDIEIAEALGQTSANPMPIHRGFVYEVRLAVSIPLAWATLLKESSKHHYDYKCRATGDHGTVNGLYNSALDGEWPSTVPVTWSDLDLTTKVAEQLEYHTANHALIRAIRAWLRETMDVIAHQRNVCMDLPGSWT
jgi:hypothetical protein